VKSAAAASVVLIECILYYFGVKRGRLEEDIFECSLQATVSDFTRYDCVSFWEVAQGEVESRDEWGGMSRECFESYLFRIASTVRENEREGPSTTNADRY
jgi:hypothetical protein